MTHSCSLKNYKVMLLSSFSFNEMADLDTTKYRLCPDEASMASLNQTMRGFILLVAEKSRDVELMDTSTSSRAHLSRSGLSSGLFKIVD